METEGWGVVEVDSGAERHEGELSCSADGSRAITGDEGGVVRVSDTETGVLCEPILRRHNTDITALAVECSKAT
jgi:hypothetical protein